MSFWLDIAAFALKALLIVAAVGGVVFLITRLTRGEAEEDSEIKVDSLNERYDARQARLNAGILSKKERKALAKQRKALAKASKKAAKSTAEATTSKRIYVLGFKGDIRASAVGRLGREIDAVLTVARPDQDEVVVRIESPGGTVTGYGLAASQLLRLRAASIKLTACVDQVAASGGYLMACVADRIIAAPFAILGSIGVVAQVPNLNRLLKKNDIDFEEMTAGEFKRSVSIFGEITPAGREHFRGKLDATHEAFKEFVGQNRPRLEMAKVANGDTWLGREALELGLVDELAASDDYLFRVRDQARIYEISSEERKSLLQQILSRLGFAAQAAARFVIERLGSGGRIERAEFPSPALRGRGSGVTDRGAKPSRAALIRLLRATFSRESGRGQPALSPPPAPATTAANPNSPNSRTSPMAARQFIYHMQGLSKTWPGGKKVLENIHLSFYPDAKIGVLGVNGSGKSTLLRIMAGIDTEFVGEGFLAEGARVGYLPQEPPLDPSLDVRGNVMLGVAAKQAILDRYNELAMNYSDESADEMTRLQDEIEAQGLWDLDSQVEQAMDALGCPPDDSDVDHALGRRAPPRRAVQAAARKAGAAAARRADEPSRRRDGQLAGRALAQLSRRDPDRHPRSLLPRQRDRLDPRARSRQGHPLRGQLLRLAEAEAEAAAAGEKRGHRAPARARRGERVDRGFAEGAAGQIEGAHRQIRGTGPEAERQGADDRADRHPRRRAARAERHRLRRSLEGFWRPVADRQALVPAAARRHRRRDRAERRGQDDAVPHDHRPGEAGLGRDQDRRIGALGYVDQSRDALDAKKTVWEEISAATTCSIWASARSIRAPIAARSTSRARTSRRRSACSRAASATACIWPRC